MFSGTFKALLKTVTNCKTKDESQPSKEPLRLRKVIRTALAVRKFQKLESDKCKRSIECEFDKTVAINELTRFYKHDKLFHLEESKKFAYYIRKFTITFDELRHVHKNLLNQFSKYLKDLDGNVNEQVRYFLCLSLKYLTRNSEQLITEIQYSDVIDCIKRCKDESVMTELVYTLTYMTEKSTLDNELINELSSLVLNRFDINEDAKGFLLTRLEISKSVDRNDQVKTDHRFKSAGKSNGNQKMNKLVVTKTIQTVKSSYNNKESEETKMIFLNLSDALKNRNRMLNMKVTLEQIDAINDTSGDDRSMWRSTWGECVNFYSLVVSQGQALKSDDKDNYLPTKLFGWHVCLNTNVLPRGPLRARRRMKVYSFFINRMIAATLLRASKKQQLNSDAIDKLMMCATDLDSFVSIALHCDDDMVDLVVDAIYDDYDEFKGLNEPDIATMFIKTIMNKTIEVVTHEGWVWNSTEVKRKQFDRNELAEIIKNEINQLRLDSLNAIHNCSIRNKQVLIKDRIKKIQKCLTNYQENDAKFMKLIFQIMCIADSTNEIDYKGTFEAYVDVLVRGTRGNHEMIINFLNNQAKDAKRSQELFIDEILSKLIDLLNSDIYSTQIKEDIIEIINNYLEHETSKALGDEHLELLIQYVQDPSNSSTSLINSVLTSILIIAEKQNLLSNRIVKKLIDNIEYFGENSSNYILLILSRVIREKNYIRNQQDLEKISFKLDCNDVVQLNNDSKIIFTPRSEQNQHGNQISLLTANLILLSVQRRVQITNKTIANLGLALNNDDKQTKIISSKCIYVLSKYASLENDALSQMKDFLNDQVYDVSVYILAAYSHGLVKLAELSEPINAMHMDNLSSLFLTQSLKLGVNDFANEINLNILEILKLEGNKQKFEDENVFVLLDSILLLDENYSSKVLDILEIYTSKYTIPKSTIRALENALDFPERFEKAIFTIYNVIRNGQSVTNKILQILVDNLYMSINARRRYNSFKLLEKVRQNQDLPESVFNTIELAKAGFVLSRSTNKTSIMKFMQDQTNNGMQLPIDTVNALENETVNEDALQVLYNISKNKQIIQYDLLNKLIEHFNPNSDQFILIGVFENVAKNNQTLSVELLKKLEMALNRKQIEDNVLSIFVYLAQKGEKLSNNIIQKILNKILLEKDIMLKQELVSALGSLTETHHTDIERYQQQIEKILADGLNSDNTNLQKICISVLRILVKFVQVSSSLFSEVITIGTSLYCDKTIKDEIYSLFTFMEQNNSELTSKYKAKIQLANLDYQSNSDLLNKLKPYANQEDALLEQNYNQLKNIIDQDFQLQEKALEILHLLKSKNKMTDDLIESLVLLYESTTSKEIKKSCLKLFEEADRSGKSLNYKAAEIVHENMKNGEVDEISRSSSKSNLYAELNTQLQLNDEQIRGLLQFSKVKINILDIHRVEMLVEILAINNPSYYDNQAFVSLIEQALLTNKITEIALPCYCRIIKEKKSNKVEEVLDKLVQNYNDSINKYDAGQYKNDEISLLPLLLESIFYSLKYCSVSERCITLLENNLDHGDWLLRSFSFKGLRMILSKNECTKSQRFQNWCDSTIENLLKAGVHIEKVKTYLDLLEVIVSLEFINLDVFKKNDKEKWIRELMISSLFEHFKACDTEQIDFYSSWFIIEEKFMYYKSVKMLSLIMQRVLNFKSITEIIDIFICMRTRLYDDVMIILNNHEFPYDTFKEDWCMEMMKSRLINKNIGENYLQRLCKNVCAEFNIKFIESLFKCISRIDNLREFEDVVEFCSIKELKLDDLCFSNVDITQLKSLLEAKHICNKINSNDEKQSYRDVLFKNLCLLIKKKWTSDQLDELTESFNSMNLNRKLENYVSTLELINQYNLSSSQYKKCSQLIRESNTFIQFLKGLNKLVIENNFQLKGKVKSPTELLNELKESNKTNSASVQYITTDLPKELEEIKREDLKSSIQYNQLPIAEWGVKQINHWSDVIKSKGERFSNVEAIAVIKRANFLFTGYHLTDTQILCSLIALKTESETETRSKLLQVATGEGKSTIVCILAIINALKNKQVHVITSSPVLAERDSKQKMKLFKMFHLTCSDNNDKTVYLYGSKDCYTADIVYGEVSQFQFDTLRDQYSMLRTLGNRKCEIAIVDEVDSMLIDDSSKIARLSSTAAGMDYFQVIYVYIWQRLLTVKERFIMFNGKMYMVNGKVEFENGKIVLEYLDNNNNIVKISDLESYVSNNNDISDIGEVINGDLDDYLKKCLDEYLVSLISEKKLEIPKNYKEFYETQKPKWIHNAIEALNYQENIHYIVQEGQIKPVDYYSTGIVQSSTNWSDGLHQFLQIKHNLKMTSETFTTNFLSNIGFINNYTTIYGLTGTLGSEKAKNVLKEVYNVDLVNVPQLRQKQYLELETIVSQDETKWVEQICSTVLIETKKDRGVLIICENIAHANRLGDLLKTQHRSTAVKLYTMNNMNQEKHVEKILPGEIIIATNLAGRGTDIRTDDIEEFGGLHVVLTFMPNNQRIEDQAFGRTARQGKRGTGLMILNSMNLIDYNHVNTTEVKSRRDKIESSMLNEFQNNELKLIQIKDTLFKKFCTFLNEEIRRDIRYNQGCFQASLNAVTDAFKTVMPTVYETNIIAAAEEQWALFLRKLDDDTVRLDHAEEECNTLIDILRKDYKEEKIIKNSYYHTVIANDIIMNQWSIRSSSKAESALSHFEKAVQLDEAASGAAYLGIAWCAIVIQDGNYKKKALESFEKSLKILSNEMAMLNSMQLLLEQKQPTFTGSELYKQFMTKVTIVGTYLNSVQGNIGAIKKSLRFIDLIEIEQQSIGNVLEKIAFYYELEKNSKNKLDIKMNKKASYNLIFNDLTSREDSVTIDQALITINNAYSNTLLSSSYNRTRDKLKQVQSYVMQAIFNQNKECLDLTKESAIHKLKNERTYCNTMRITDSFQVDLKIIHSNNKTEEFKNKQMNELIALIETKMDDTLRFDIIIKDANVNGINKYFKSTINNSTCLQVDFVGLDSESINEKLSSIKAKSINIEMVLTKSLLLTIIGHNTSINMATVCVTEQKLYEKVNRNELMKRVAELKNEDSYFYVKFESLQTDQIRNIICDCKEISFNISFIGIDFYNSINGLNGQTNFYFNNLNQTTSKTVINDLRKENMEFCLEFKDLTDDQVEYIVANANLAQENIQISKVKNLMELYTKGSSMPTVELNEFTAKGIEYMIEINEKRFVPWRSVIAVAILGSLQIIAGGVLIATGFGATVGMGLITEGIADMFTAYRAFSNRQFTWEDYCKQKAVSLVISAVSMGYSKLKDAGKGVKTLVGSAGKEAVEQAGTQLVTNTKTIGETVVQTGKNLKNLAFKYTGVKAGEAVVREGLNSGVQYLSKFSFDLIKPQISESVQSKIRVMFSKPDLTYLLRKMYALDLQTKSKILQCKVDQIVADTINPQHDFARRQWDSIGVPLLKGVLADVKNYGGVFSMAIRIIGTLNGIYALQTLIDNVYIELVKKLSQIDKNTMTITLVLHRNLKIDKEIARNVVNKFKNLEILDENDNLKLSSHYDVSDECTELKSKIDEFNRQEKDQTNVAQFMKSFCDNYMQVEYDSFSVIIKSVADKITEQLIQIIESQLIQPWSTLAVSSVTNSISNRIQHNYLTDKNQNSDSHNKDQEKYDELKNKTNLTEEEQMFMKNYGKYRTITEQINYNAKDYCIAYSQCEIIYHSQQAALDSKNKYEALDSETQKHIDDIKNDKPADLADMMGLAAENGIAIKIVDDPAYEPTEEDVAKGTKIIVYTKGETDNEGKIGIGHYQLKGENGDVIDLPSINNNCGYAVIQKILQNQGTDISIDDLRNQRAAMIQNNPTQFMKTREVEKWIETRHPQEANRLLVVGAKDTQQDRLNANQFDGIEEDAGTYKKLNKKYIGRRRRYELNHIPPKNSLKGTRFEHVNPNDLPVIPMAYDDHRCFISTGRSAEATQYRERLREYLKNGNMYDTLKMELSSMLKVPPQGIYQDRVAKFLDVAATTEILNYPKRGSSKPLLSPQQAADLRRDLFG
ncbi:unnamed protein product [Rotaria magnacalcarata]|uniref:Uncharacterized protein n=1 Tax=Rotaria magnacalcarata TaxID=392030 RepID=A0A816XAS5_9BILA|nr:unnamed protein product [Rotaria magnacalcarata]CAF3800335.1 unnamed protein product [Rotaria magnacalcarata]